MNNKTILVRDVSSLSEARYCAGMQVDFICFEFNPNSENYIEDSKREEIIQWLSGVKIIGSYKNGSLADIKNTVEQKVLDGFLFENQQSSYVNSVLVDNKFLEIVELSKSNNISEDIFILSSMLLNREKNLLCYDFSNPQNFPEAQGYAFIGSKELRPGFNAYDELMDAFEAIENQ